MRLRFGFRLPFPFGNAFIFVKRVDIHDGLRLIRTIADVRVLASAMGFGAVVDRIVCEES